MTLNVKIYRPSKTAMQAGRAKVQSWILEYQATSARKPDDLIGWSGSEDTLNQVRLSFETVEQAIAHAQKNGWLYSVLPAQDRKIRPRNYGDNFKYFPPEKKNAKKV